MVPSRNNENHDCYQIQRFWWFINLVLTYYQSMLFPISARSVFFVIEAVQTLLASHGKKAPKNLFMNDKVSSIEHWHDIMTNNFSIAKKRCGESLKELTGLRGINAVKRLKIQLKCFEPERPPKVNCEQKMFITINARNMQCCVFISFKLATKPSRAGHIKCVSCFLLWSQT